MNFCYEQDQNYIRLDLMPQCGGALRVDIYTRSEIAVQAADIEASHTHQNDQLYQSWTKFMLQPGQSATLTYAGQTCTIRYGEDKKVRLSGDLPIAPYYNGLDPRELEECKNLVIE
jgi:hypothetical protein